MHHPLPALIANVRFLTGALGERAAWWPGQCTGAAAPRSLQMLFPQTWQRAALESVVESAWRVHDERLGPRSFHLFRLPDDVEDRLAAWLARPDANLTVPDCDRDAILGSLRSVATTGTASPGPLCHGRPARLAQPATFHELAATYLDAAETGVTVIPYFEE